MRWSAIFTILVSMSIAGSLGAQPRVEARLDRNQILVGEQIKVIVDVSTADGYAVSPLDHQSVNNTKGLEVVEIGRRDTTRDQSNRLLIRQELMITSFDSGSQWVPALKFSFEKNGTSTFRESNRLPFEVTTLAVVDSIGLAPIKPILLEQKTFWDKYKYVVIGLGGLGLLALIIYFFRSVKTRREAVVLTPPKPKPHVVALEKLERLKSEKLWQQGLVKEYQSQLTYIVREYLEGRYGIQALESTTREIIDQLKGLSFSDEIKKQLSEMLNLADMVKFAKAEPPIEYHEKLMEYAESFVMQTKPTLEEQAAELAETTDVRAIMLGLTLGGYDFVNPAFFLLLFLIPLVGFLYYWRRGERFANIRMSNLEGIKNFKSLRAALMPYLPILRALSFVFLVIALARPQEILKEEEINAEGIDIALVMDLSSSMLAQDFKPDRLQVSKKVASDFVDKRMHDRIGMAVFAGEAFTQCPLTTDHRVLKEFLGNLECGILKDGTAIGDGLATAVNRIKDSDAKSKVVILLTDGDNNAGYIKPMTAAEIAREFNVKVYTIGVGSRGQALAPVSRRSDGQYIFGLAKVQIDESLLKKISEITGGKYFRATSAEKLQQIYNDIDQLEKTKIEVTSIKRYNEEYHRFALWGVLLLLLEAILRFTIFRTIP